MQCPNCGHTPPEESRFCNICGQRLAIQEAPATSADSPSGPPEWYRNLAELHSQGHGERPPEGTRRVEFGIAGRQPKKWVAELMPGQKVRIAFARGAIQPRSPRPWERAAAVPTRHPWTNEKEGSLLLIVENQAYRYADIRDQWVSVPDRSQVYLGIQDTRHDDNRGDYGGVLEITEPDAV